MSSSTPICSWLEAARIPFCAVLVYHVWWSIMTLQNLFSLLNIHALVIFIWRYFSSDINKILITIKLLFHIYLPKCIFVDVNLMSKLIEFHFAHVTVWRSIEAPWKNDQNNILVKLVNLCTQQIAALIITSWPLYKPWQWWARSKYCWIKLLFDCCLCENCDWRLHTLWESGLNTLLFAALVGY